ncbi:sirohydrochlorin chelatase [Zobellella denitrificans]|jgi:sirohydrochlorin ferrochelatase|uniref:Cobalamin biosynthesis protein CbiX n=1 Tax=Zobellella denitrificans TaxID=347534 RepID=A0A291HS80_9GAMM|nr:CbiX/SirB N-terminal domain-containing protein [Zobellella denitrificans]ATG75005.1 cobalamin biosynthesis protein CbiX [Zobellella denitrificans]
MKGFILVAHGSRRAAANDEIAAFAGALAEGMGDKFAVIGHGFWELAEPSLEQAIDAQVAAGATDIRLFPYFLAQGKHVVKDLPSVLEQKREQYPQLSITLLPHLGALPGFANWLGRQL